MNCSPLRSSPLNFTPNSNTLSSNLFNLKLCPLQLQVRSTWTIVSTSGPVSQPEFTSERIFKSNLGNMDRGSFGKRAESSSALIFLFHGACNFRPDPYIVRFVGTYADTTTYSEAFGPSTRSFSSLIFTLLCFIHWK